MKRIKKGFISWYYNFIDKRKEKVVELTIVKYFESGHEQHYLFIECNEKAISKQVILTNNQIKWEKQAIIYDNCHFTREEIEINLEEEDLCIKGQVAFKGKRGTNRSKWQAGIMGPFRYLPFLQSYHDVISLGHELVGSLTINGEEIQLNDGKGYMEIEWGKEYPKVWIWSQCNHFKENDVSLMVGVTRMPILWEYYTSFAVPVYYKGQLVVFSNYNGGQIAKLYRYKSYVHLIITQKSKMLDLKIYGEDDVEHTSARGSHMIRDVYSCQKAKMEIKMTQSNKVILEDVGYCCQLEMGGNTSKLK